MTTRKMENDPGELKRISVPEVRLILIGGRWAGKSSSGNTILRSERFECGRIRTVQSELRHQDVEGRTLIVVDAPGWSSSLSLTEIPELDKQRFKLNPSKCSPGPHVFLLVIPIDSAFSVEQKMTVEEHMKLLGERVWKYTMVLFTCGDFLGEKTIEQHIESEGEALKSVTERCRNRYHVFNNKERSDSAQVTLLLEKIDEMVHHNHSSYYETDEQTLNIIKEKQRGVMERAQHRRKRTEEQRQQMKSLISEARTIQKLQIILLGSRNVGKTSLGNAILGIKEREDGKRTAESVAHRGFVGKTEVTLVDTPGWWKGFPALDTPEAIKEEVMRSMFVCPPGPHVFLLVLDADASFNAKHLDAVTTHLELLGEGVWKHTITVFTRGDWLGAHTIEEYIEGEGEALQSLVEQCGNRYHVVDNKNADDGTQITELLEKIMGTVAANGWSHFVPDDQIRVTIEERRIRVEQGAKQRQSQVKAKMQTFKDSRNKLQEVRLVLLGQKTFGKSATGNTLLRKEVFATCQNEYCQVEEGEVAGRRITVIDTPGWYMNVSQCNQKTDEEIVRSLSLSPLGFHAVLLVVPLDLTFGDVQLATLEDHINLFDDSVWKHTVVVFTYGDKLADKSVEEHIEREPHALRRLVDKSDNRYHVINNMKKTDLTQVTKLFEKIEEMVSGNNGRLFCPDMNMVHVRLEEKFSRRQLKYVLKQRLEEEYRRREVELKKDFMKTLVALQAEIKENVTSTKHKPLVMAIGQKKKESNIDLKISQMIEELEKDIARSSQHVTSSMEFLIPSLSGGSPVPSVHSSEPSLRRKKANSNFDKVLGWLSTLKISTNMENQLTLNFSQTSGYRSNLPQDDFDIDTTDDIPDD
ncbi:GTPase IMAP family member 8-like isoform X2 [Sphaeramia orbicularis]|uniref:GTPase IMAP family member 8-like isoform X2 n=1 Tax=Sphaeramia orbicularis TaxID=375764 RepID=UPI00117D9F46|nr:GTPase IMAP family member 8-like isoform X2 [Sphaeramia orbicularis]